jgi:hypothetical protein
MSTDKTANDPNKFVSVTGASLKCDLHGIDTFDLNEWNEHCSDPANGHVENGTVKCISCPNIITFENLPYVPLTVKGKTIELICDQCMDKHVAKQTPRGVTK